MKSMQSALPVTEENQETNKGEKNKKKKSPADNIAQESTQTSGQNNETIRPHMNTSQKPAGLQKQSNAGI